MAEKFLLLPVEPMYVNKTLKYFENMSFGKTIFPPNFICKSFFSVTSNRTIYDNSKRLSKFYNAKILDDKKCADADNTSRSHKLLLDAGLIESYLGTNTLLPLFMPSLYKLKKLVQKEMKSISAQEISLPCLTSAKLLKKTGRLEMPQLFTTTDHEGCCYVLSPTHEEAVTHLVAKQRIFQRELPIKLYQISTKFRDELRPKFGLIRSKEFLMKDLYCFDDSEQSAHETYYGVLECYHRFFKSLNVPYTFVKSENGDMGGAVSHEFHFITNTGDDYLLICNDCCHGKNLKLGGSEDSCDECNSKNVKKHRGIEVGHTFLLGEKYTRPLNCQFIDKNNKEEYLEMSCYGLGLTRIISGALEILSKPDELRWPLVIAPYLICFLPPKKGSKEESCSKQLINEVYSMLKCNFDDDLLVDDRVHLTIGKRLSTIKLLGIPYIVIIRKKILEETPQVEVYNLYKECSTLVNVCDLECFIKNQIANALRTNFNEENSNTQSACE